MEKEQAIYHTLLPSEIENVLRRSTSSPIYKRGLFYFQRGMVKDWHVETSDDFSQTALITGNVRGTEIYTVTFTLNIAEKKIADMTCTCPYEDVCKHIVALGLDFAESVKIRQKAGRVQKMYSTSEAHYQTTTETSTETEEERLLVALRNSGVNTENMPHDLLKQLLQYQQQKTPSPASTHAQKHTSPQRTLKPFNPADFAISLSSYRGYAPTLHQKKNVYGQKTSMSKILAHSDIPDAERALVTYIKNGNFEQYMSSPPDPLILFPLLLATSFPIYRDYSYANKPLSINLTPSPLSAEIVYEQKHFYDDDTKIRHDFFLRLPAEHLRGKNTLSSPQLSIIGSSLILDTQHTLELHQITPLLADIIARLSAVESFTGNRRNIAYYQARLQPQEVTQFDRVVADVSHSFALTTPPPSLTPRTTETKPHSAFLVDYDRAEQSLSVTPVLDYSIYQQDISESVYVSRRVPRSILGRREPFAHPGTHIITVTGTEINHAPVNAQKEIDFYRELAAQAPELGFTKTLKCNRTGERQVQDYLHTFWPKLSSYAKTKNYPILFSRDEIKLEQANFTAHFTTDISADGDWLYFDVACYCGDEKMTLEKLLAFIHSGERYFRKDDGTLVDIANREDLAQLARLLKSFHARENGRFEGALHHAPELQYVMTFSPHYSAAQGKSFERFVAEVHTGKPIKKVRLPAQLAKIARPYQKTGIEWLYFLRSYRFGGILADDMGLGKTVQALAILSLEKVKGRPSLVICPKTLLYNWKLEAEKFFPELSVMVYDGTPSERTQLQKKIKQQDMVVASYGTIKQDRAIFAAVRFNYVVLDEAQNIKNHATKNAQVVKELNADFRLALTGTPLENSVSEIWSVYDFLMPGFLGTFENFAERFHRPIMEKGDTRALEHLRMKIESFMLRRTKSEVLTELPPKIEQASQCQLSEAQNILYQQILAKVRGEVFGAVREHGFKSAQIHILAGLTKLRQACNHPALLIKDKNFRKYESAKLDMCMELVEEVVHNQRKVLLFSQFTGMLDIVAETLHDKKIPYVYLSGKTKNRQQLIDTFNTDPSIPVFLISLKAGGTGLNLTAADTVIIFDPWWNPSVENQAIDRAHRIGQTKAVNVYRLSTKGTIEEKIQALKQKKQRLFDALIGESGDLFSKLTWDDVQELFTS